MNENLDSNLISPCEKNFKKFLEEKEIMAVFLHQSPSSFPKNMQLNGAKRPDFCIHTPFGEFYVDIKTSRLKRYPKFTISLLDLSKLDKTMHILEKSIYVAYPIDPWGIGLDWGFISIKKLNILKKDQDDWIKSGHDFIGIDYIVLKRYNELI